MKKPYKHTEKSHKTCFFCKKPLKLNLLTKKPNANVCYKCYKQLKLEHLHRAVIEGGVA